MNEKEFDIFTDQFLRKWRNERNTNEAVYAAYHYDFAQALAKAYAKKLINGIGDDEKTPQETRVTSMYYADGWSDFRNAALNKLEE